MFGPSCFYIQLNCCTAMKVEIVCKPHLHLPEGTASSEGYWVKETFRDHQRIHMEESHCLHTSWHPHIPVRASLSRKVYYHKGEEAISSDLSTQRFTSVMDISACVDRANEVWVGFRVGKGNRCNLIDGVLWASAIYCGSFYIWK